MAWASTHTCLDNCLHSAERHTSDRQLALLNSIEAGILLCGNGGFRHGGPSLSLARTVRLSVTRSRLLPPRALYLHFLPYLTIAPIALSVLSL